MTKVYFEGKYFIIGDDLIHIETGKDNPILRTICEPVKSSEWKKYTKIGKEMIKYIRDPEHMGAGLAGPQIGIKKRIIVVSMLRDWNDENYSTIMMINPRIIEHSEDFDREKEGCLSLPKSPHSEVTRPKEIKLEYFDEKNNKKVIRVGGTASRIIQHEIDHLDGILYIDRD